MQREEGITVRRRRTGAEVRRLVAEFVSSDMRRSEFCHSRGLSLSTLGRHLRKKKRKSSAGDGLVAVELGIRKSPAEHEPSGGLAVVLAGGRRIEVRGDFDPQTLERLVSVLERV